MRFSELPGASQKDIKSVLFMGLDTNELFIEAYKKYILRQSASVSDAGKSPCFSMLLLDRRGLARVTPKAIISASRVRISLTGIFEKFAFSNHDPATAPAALLACHLIHCYFLRGDLSERTVTVAHLKDLVTDPKHYDESNIMVLHPTKYERYDEKAFLRDVVADLHATFGNGAETVPLRVYSLDDATYPDEGAPPLYELGANALESGNTVTVSIPSMPGAFTQSVDHADDHRLSAQELMTADLDTVDEGKFSAVQEESSSSVEEDYGASSESISESELPELAKGDVLVCDIHSSDSESLIGDRDRIFVRPKREVFCIPIPQIQERRANRRQRYQSSLY